MSYDEQTPSNPESQQPQQQQQEAGYEPLELEDHSDGSWIEVRQAELIELTEENGDGPLIYREVLSGKTLVSWRKRTPEDGDAEYVTIPPKSKRNATEEQLTLDTFREWRNRVLNEGSRGRVDPRLIKQVGEPKSLYRSLTETGGPNGHYNEGVQRWNETAE